jgi:hypothetical protein
MCCSEPPVAWLLDRSYEIYYQIRKFRPSLMSQTATAMIDKQSMPNAEAVPFDFMKC